MSKDQALRLALEALKSHLAITKPQNKHIRHTSLPQENYMDNLHDSNEPVAWGMMNDDGKIYDCICPEEHDRVEGEYTVPLYTSPPKREPLTDERVSLVREMRDVQGYDGNWNYDPYMQGLYNGLEFAVSLLEKREPVFRDAPKQWLGDISKKRDNFNIVGSKIAAHGIKGEA